MSDRERVTKEEYEALAGFRYAVRQFLHFSEEAAHAAGLTSQQHQALLAIRGYPGRDAVTVGELAERLQIRPHSAVGLVDRLAAQGMVDRHHGEKDHRQVYVALTPQGAAALEALTASHRAELARLGPHLADLLARLMGDAGPETG